MFNKPTSAVYLFDVCGLEINDIDICGNRQKTLPDLQKKIQQFLRDCDDPGREGKASAKNWEKEIVWQSIALCEQMLRRQIDQRIWNPSHFD